MNILGIAGVFRRKTTRIIVVDPTVQRFLVRIQRAWSQVQRPDQWWVADFMYVHTSCGFSYVVFVIDVFNREILAYVVDTRATKSLVIRTLSRPRVIHYLDAGLQGGFNWLSQHPEHGGVRRWLPRTGVRRPVICRWG
ncbi:DDE-type integrase/transposase/recombinase, partial [Corynebacterium diphtheriae]